MSNLKQNCKISEVSKFASIRVAVLLDEDVDPGELTVYLEFLQSLSKAIMAQIAIFRRHLDIYQHTIEGLEKDLEENNKEIDHVQKILVQLRSFEDN